MEAKLKHLEFIQGVINRLASGSFLMKRWAVVLVSAILVLAAREGRIDLAYIGFAPVIVFWGLDGYFLWQERLFRDMYNHVRALDGGAIDFSMDTSTFKQKWLNAILSRTLSPVYLMLSVSIVLAMVIS